MIMMAFLSDFWTYYVLEFANECGVIAALIVFGIPALIVCSPILFIAYGIISAVIDEIRMSLMTKEQKEAFLQKRKEKAAKDAAALARVREIEAESRMRKYQCPVCGYSSADNEFLDLYGKSTGECRCRRCGKRFYC
jgi:hypothetical protein